MKPTEILKEKSHIPIKAKQTGIYMIYCVIDEKGYIGQSRNMRTRINMHKRALKNNNHENSHLQNIYNKYGDSTFLYIILELCPKESLLAREIYYYSLLQEEYRINLREPSYMRDMTKEEINKGVNKRKGWIMSEENKKAISIRMKGRIFSEETKRSMSESRKKYIKDNKEKIMIHIQNLADKRRGEKMSLEVCKKMSNSRIGKQHIQYRSRYLDVSKVLEIKELLKNSSLTYTEIGKRYKISYWAVSQIKKGKTWKHVN